MQALKKYQQYIGILINCKYCVETLEYTPLMASLLVAREGEERKDEKQETRRGIISCYDYLLPLKLWQVTIHLLDEVSVRDKWENGARQAKDRGDSCKPAQPKNRARTSYYQAWCLHELYCNFGNVLVYQKNKVWISQLSEELPLNLC